MRLLFVCLLVCVAHARDAYVTLLTNYDYLKGARVLGRSLWEQEHAHHQNHPTIDMPHIVFASYHEKGWADERDRVIMVPQSLLEEQKGLEDYLIYTCRWTHVYAYREEIENPFVDFPAETFATSKYASWFTYMGENEQKRMRSTFNKLHVFDLVQYDRIVYLDADTLVRRPISHLFNCVGHSYEISTRHRAEDRWSWFRFCAYQNEAHNGKLSWDFQAGVMVLTPSHTMRKDIMENALSLGTNKNLGDNGLLANYLFWQCEEGSSKNLRETIEKREEEIHWKFYPTALPNLWYDSKTMSEIPKDLLRERVLANNSQTQWWPMAQCQRLPEEYNMRTQHALHDKDVYIVHFQDSVWKPFFWQSYMLTGYFDEWRSFYVYASGFETILTTFIIFTLGTAIVFYLVGTFQKPPEIRHTRYISSRRQTAIICLSLLPAALTYFCVTFYSTRTHPKLILACVPLLVGSLSTTCISFLKSVIFIDYTKILFVFYATGCTTYLFYFMMLGCSLFAQNTVDLLGVVFLLHFGIAFSSLYLVLTPLLTYGDYPWETKVIRTL